MTNQEKSNKIIVEAVAYHMARTSELTGDDWYRLMIGILPVNDVIAEELVKVLGAFPQYWINSLSQSKGVSKD